MPKGGDQRPIFPDDDLPLKVRSLLFAALFAHPRVQQRYAALLEETRIVRPLLTTPPGPRLDDWLNLPPDRAPPGCDAQEAMAWEICWSAVTRFCRSIRLHAPWAAGAVLHALVQQTRYPRSLIQPLAFGGVSRRWKVGQGVDVRLGDERLRVAWSPHRFVDDPETRPMPQVLAASAREAGRPLSFAERRAISRQAAPQIQAQIAALEQAGWSRRGRADLVEHAEWTAQRLLHPEMTWEALADHLCARTGLKLDIRVVQRAIGRYAELVELTLP